MSRNGRFWPRASAMVVGLLATLSLPAAAQSTDAEFFGRHPPLERKLANTITVAWEDIPLRAATRRLADTQQLPVWIDRRLDPTQKLKLDQASVQLSGVCDEMARQGNFAWIPYGGLVYFGPASAASELRTLRALRRDELKSLGEEARQKWLHPQTLAMPRLSEPRQLVEQLARSLGVQIENPNDIPHDLWRGGEFPAMGPADWLTLILASFDRTWQVDSRGTALRVVPIKRPVIVERLVAEGESADKATELAAGYPEAKIRREGKQVYLAARVEQHEQLAGKPERIATRPQRSEPGRQVYSLAIRDQPLKPLLEQLATKLGLALEIDAELAEQPELLEQRVSFEVREVGLDELAFAIGTAATLKVEVVEGKLRVSQ